MSRIHMEIRAGTAADADEIVHLWQSAGSPPTPTDTAPHVRAAMAHPGMRLFVMVIEGQIVGSVIGAFDGWRGNIYRLAVHPDYRRRGIARALVAEVERSLDSQGVQRINALVEREDSDAMGFWDAAGYPADFTFVRRLRDRVR